MNQELLEKAKTHPFNIEGCRKQQKNWSFIAEEDLRLGNTEDYEDALNRSNNWKLLADAKELLENK